MIGPDFLLAGGHKCATTTLHDQLSRHPQVIMSQPKEPHFLARHSLEHRLHAGVWDAGDYRRLWQADTPKRRLWGEASVLYLAFYEDTIRAVREDLDEPPRIVLSLRDPVERALSSYVDSRLTNPRESAPFFERSVQRELLRGPRRLDGAGSPTLRHLALGFYADGVRGFMRAFGAENVKVLLFEELKADPDGTWRELQAFLGLEETPWVTGEPLNVGGREWKAGAVAAVARSRTAVRGRRLLRRVAPGIHSAVRTAALWRMTVPTQPMASEVRAVLTDLYADDVTDLSSLLGRSLDAWARPNAEE